MREAIESYERLLRDQRPYSVEEIRLIEERREQQSEALRIKRRLRKVY